jgi:hypothetical protein
VVWGIFAVPDDPSRSGKAPVSVPGSLRLVLETLIFGLAGSALIASDVIIPGVLFIVLVIIHYALSWDRIKWLTSV